MAPGWLKPKESLSNEYYVQPDCWNSWIVFQDVSDQWRFKPDGQLIGLDMPAAMLAIEAVEPDKSAQLKIWRDLRSIADGVKQAIRDNADE